LQSFASSKGSSPFFFPVKFKDYIEKLGSEYNMNQCFVFLNRVTEDESDGDSESDNDA